MTSEEKKVGRPPPEVQPIRSELALVLDHLDQARQLDARATQSLREARQYVKRELWSLERRTPKYSAARFPEREKILRRLDAVHHREARLALAGEVRGGGDRWQ